MEENAENLRLFTQNADFDLGMWKSSFYNDFVNAEIMCSFCTSTLWLTCPWR